MAASKEVLRKEQDLRMMFENELQDEPSMRKYVTNLERICDQPGKTIWDMLHDDGVISVEKGYEALLEALEAHHQNNLARRMRVKAEEIKKERISQDNADRRRPFLSTSSSFDEDEHKNLLLRIGKELNNQDVLRDIKCILKMEGSFTEKECRGEGRGYALLCDMEKRGLIKRGNYEKLREVLKEVNLNKFSELIGQTEQNLRRKSISRSVSRTDELANYAVLDQDRCYMARLGIFSDNLCNDMIENMNFVKLSTDAKGHLNVPEEAEMVVICSSFDMDKSEKSISNAFPQIEAFNFLDSQTPFIYLIDVRCSQLPEKTLSIPVMRPHVFVVLLFSTDKRDAEELWEELSNDLCAFANDHTIEYIVKYWSNQALQTKDNESVLILSQSSLTRQLYLSSERRPVYDIPK